MDRRSLISTAGTAGAGLVGILAAGAAPAPLVANVTAAGSTVKVTVILYLCVVNPLSTWLALDIVLLEPTAKPDTSQLGTAPVPGDGTLGEHVALSIVTPAPKLGLSTRV